MFTLFWVKEVFYTLNKILTEIFDLEIKGKIVRNIQVGKKLFRTWKICENITTFKNSMLHDHLKIFRRKSNEKALCDMSRQQNYLIK